MTSLIEIILLNTLDIEVCLKIKTTSKENNSLVEEVFPLLEFKNTTFKITEEKCDCGTKRPRLEPFNKCSVCSKKKENTISATNVKKDFRLKEDDLEKLNVFGSSARRYFYKKDVLVYSLIKYGPSKLYKITNPGKINSVAKQKRIERVKKYGIDENSTKWRYCAMNFIDSPTYNPFKDVIYRAENYDKFEKVYETLDDKEKEYVNRAFIYYTSTFCRKYDDIENIEDHIINCIDYMKFLDNVGKDLKMFLPHLYRSIDVFFFGERPSFKEAKEYVILYFKNMKIKI
jgi:hypothetical protein